MIHGKRTESWDRCIALQPTLASQNIRSRFTQSGYRCRYRTDHPGSVHQFPAQSLSNITSVADLYRDSQQRMLVPC
ncbi:unnamed protein product [Periconia digitata]|uniref:Uncharacterized protein n=1 Tax=Periconia digitata TaxID=1303443 RepID=A0A9W4UME7_9PLEO|nr:unnamed protein product [Periconia digitata]